MKKAPIAGATAARLLVPAVPFGADTTDGCFIGSPNIIRDLQECLR